MEVKAYAGSGEALGKRIPEDSHRDHDVVVFDSLGFQELKNFPGSDGSKNMRWEQVFNESGFLVEQMFYIADTLSGKDVFGYDASGFNTKWQHFTRTGKLTKTNTYTYDENNHWIQRAFYDSSGNLEVTADFIYDEEGNKTGTAEYWPGSGGPSHARENIYKYDNYGHLIEQTGMKKNGPPDMKTIYLRDTKGNLIEKKTYRGDSVLVSRRTYTYDKKHNRISATYYIQDITSHEKDKDGKMIEKIHMEKLNDPVSFISAVRYKYDKKGNWIESYKTGRGPQQILNRRKIEYF